jgi:hypothetical protein
VVVTPFFTTEKAWFWAVAVWQFKANPKGPEPRLPRVDRPCEYTDILREAARLGLTQRAVQVMVEYGRQGRPPGRKAPEHDRRLWADAMDRLHTKLRAKRIVVPAVEWADALEGNV